MTAEHFGGREVVLRHRPSEKELKEDWVPWAEREGVRKLIARTGAELWPNPKQPVDLDDGVEDEGGRDQ